MYMHTVHPALILFCTIISNGLNQVSESLCLILRYLIQSYLTTFLGITSNPIKLFGSLLIFCLFSLGRKHNIQHFHVMFRQNWLAVDDIIIVWTPQL